MRQKVFLNEVSLNACVSSEWCEIMRQCFVLATRYIRVSSHDGREMPSQQCMKR